MYSPIFCAVCPGATEKRDNQDVLVKGTWFLSTKGLGSHKRRPRVRQLRERRPVEQLAVGGAPGSSSPPRSGAWGGTSTPVIDDSSYFEYYPIPQLAQKSKLRTQSVFVNDTWKLNGNFSFNVGLRYDKNDATDQGGAKTANDDAFSPRLSATWDPKGDGKLHVTASYATYVGQLQEGIAGSGASSAGTPASYYYYWTGAPINADPNASLLTTTQVLQRMFAALGVTGLNQFPNVPPDSVTLPGREPADPERREVAEGGRGRPRPRGAPTGRASPTAWTASGGSTGTSTRRGATRRRGRSRTPSGTSTTSGTSGTRTSRNGSTRGSTPPSPGGRGR